MKATSKSILFTRVTVGKAVHQWATGVFSNPVSARTYAAYLKMAHSSGLVDQVRKLDPKTRTDDEGKLIPGVRFSIVTVSYEPSPGGEIGDEDISEESPAE